MEFDLFKLHKKIDIHPRSWICIKGKGIKELVNEIENRIIKEKRLSRERLSKILAKKLNCYFTSFKRIFRGQVNYFPIPFIQEIVSLCNDNNYLDEIHSKIEFLKVNSVSSNGVFAIKNLNEDLAKYFKCNKCSLLSYLTIMKNNNLIKSSNNPDKINKRFVNNLTQVFLNENIHSFIFNKIKKDLGTYKNFGKKLDMHKATISAWKLRKNRIPLNILKEICNLCYTDFSIILNNIKETDREIIEVV